MSDRPAIARPHPAGRWRSWLGSLLLLLAVGSVTGQELRAPEPHVKAAFLYNFAKLVYWPTNTFASSNAPFIIGVLGKDDVADALDQGLAGRTIEGHAIGIVRLDSVRDATNCHVLFISDSERRKLPAIMTSIATQPILSVSDIKGFSDQGIIELVRTNSNFTFRLNLEAARRAGLRLSSQLMRLDRTLRPPSADATNPPPAARP